MRDMRFIKRALFVLSLALIAWMPSSAQADDQSMGTNIPAQKQEIQKETIQTDIIQEPVQIQREPTIGELGKESEREMSLPPSGGPTLFDMDMTREQEATASLAF